MPSDLTMPAAADPTPDDLDSDHIGRILKALGNPVRIDLLKSLRSPKLLSEIKVQPRRRDGALSPGRFISRVTVKEHLGPLLELGVVRRRSGTRDGQTVDLYSVNHRQLFALTEELRCLALLRPNEHSQDETKVAQHPDVPAPATGPHLVLVSGVVRGKVFPLEGEPGDAGWRIGRKRGLPVCLDYDPYLSTQNSVVREHDGGFVVDDIESARNGTTLNWKPLKRGGRASLAHGDVIGVGRSLLLFRER